MELALAAGGVVLGWLLSQITEWWRAKRSAELERVKWARTEVRPAYATFVHQLDRFISITSETVPEFALQAPRPDAERIVEEAHDELRRAFAAVEIMAPGQVRALGRRIVKFADACVMCVWDVSGFAQPRTGYASPDAAQARSMVRSNVEHLREARPVLLNAVRADLGLEVDPLKVALAPLDE